MGMNKTYSLIVILVIALVTFGTRVAPFLFFREGKPTPKYILYLGKSLPPAIMSMLIIYSLKNTSLINYPFGLPEAIAVLTVVLLHVWKRNNLISILGGTVVYMVAIQYIFAK